MKIIFQVTAVILLLSIIACNAAGQCRCGDLGEGTNPCNGKTEVKTRKCTVPGHRREKPHHYASPAAIKAARASKEAEKAIVISSPSLTTVVKSGRPARLGGYGGCKSTSSSFHFQNTNPIDSEEYHRDTSKLKKLSPSERVFPRFKPIELASSSSLSSSSSSSSLPSLQSSGLNIRVRPAKPSLPKCKKCGDKVGPLPSCGHQSSQSTQSFSSANPFITFNDQGVPKLTEIQFPLASASVSSSNPAPTSNCNLNDFDEAMGAPGMSFADQEKLYRGQTKPVNIPADPISQKLFFEHVLEQAKQGKRAKKISNSMTEAKLNFGPVQRPQNVEQNKTKIEAQESKLYSFDGPIIELIKDVSQPTCAETIEEHQENREMLERIQHESLHQKKQIAESSPSLQYSYSNLGYKPVKKNSNTFVIRDSCASSSPSLTIEPVKPSCGCSGSGGSSCNGACGCKGGTNCNGSCGCSGCNNSKEDSIHPPIENYDNSYESGSVVVVDSSSVESAPSYSSESKVYCKKCKNLYY